MLSAHSALQDFLLVAAGGLAIVVGAIHGILGETHVFRRATIKPPRLRLLLRAIWQCSAIAWMGGGVLLLVAPRLETDARHWIVLSFAAIYAVGIIGNAWVFRGRHPGWLLLSAVVALSLAGM